MTSLLHGFGEWLLVVMLSGEGSLQEFCLERDRGEEQGLFGEDEEEDEVAKQRSFLALRMTEWIEVSGPKAKRIISFSPWSWIRSIPMILEAFSGSRVWILW